MWKDTGRRPVRKETGQCQQVMEQDRVEKGQAQVAGAGLAAADSKKAQRQELEKGKAAGAVDVATG